jgi:hypothetical protein
MTRSDRAIQQATLAVAVFDAGWPAPDLELLDDLSDELSPIRATIGKALADLDAVPATSRPTEAVVGLRMLVAFALSPHILGGRLNSQLSSETEEYGLYVASYVPGVAPVETLREALEAVRTWLGWPAVQGIIRTVAEALEQRQILSGEETTQVIWAALPTFGIDARH